MMFCWCCCANNANSIATDDFERMREDLIENYIKKQKNSSPKPIQFHSNIRSFDTFSDRNHILKENIRRVLKEKDLTAFVVLSTEAYQVFQSRIATISDRKLDNYVIIMKEQRMDIYDFEDIVDSWINESKSLL